MKTKALLTFFFFAIIAGTSFGQELNAENTSEIVTGKIIQKKAYNKAGNELPGPGDYYLEIKNGEYFIKIMESNITSDELSVFLNKKMEFEIEMRNGLWDTDNPEVQSRVGDYVVILRVLE